MNDSSLSSSLPDHGEAIERETEFDVLAGRIVDAEASPRDIERFLAIAKADPSLWQRLGERQCDMAMLRARLAPQMQAAERIDLPGDHPIHLHRTARVWPWLAVSGWAAMIALALTWAAASLAPDRQHDFRAGAGVGSGGGEGPAGSVGSRGGGIIHASATPSQIEPEEHLARYLNAPFVLGEMAPTLLEVEQMSDGRYAVRILRRIEEIAFIDSTDELRQVLDEEGNLTTQPSELRDEQLPAPRPN